jgi:low temperature requirement protein LtrA
MTPGPGPADPAPASPSPASPSPASPSPASPSPASPSPADTAETEELPLRVSTLEIFFDLVFAFTLTQLTAVLADRLTWLAVAQVLLVFGLLWWMYGAYAWLTNARPPVHTAERLLLLVGMAGFLAIGLAIPQGFGHYGIVLGLGYLLVVLVHTGLYYRVNANILRVAPFNIGSALLVTVAGLLDGRPGAGPASYALWLAALAVQLGSPLVVHPQGLFELRPSHFRERHSALLIVAIGESVAAVGIGAAGPASRGSGVSWPLLASAVLGLAVAAALWWLVLGSGQEEGAEQALTQASGERRTALALNAFFYGYIPLLLGLVAIAAGILREVVQAAGAGPALGTPASAGQAAVLAGGAALFLAGGVIIIAQLGLGQVRPRAVAAVLALATIPVGILAGLNVQLVLVAVVLVGPLVAESRSGRGPAGEAAGGQWAGAAGETAGQPAGDDGAG